MAESVQPLRERLRLTAADAMLDAAEKAMTDKGFEKTTMQDIAAAAGCAVGTLYLHFKTKDDLFRALVRRHGQELDRRIREGIARASNPVSALESVVITHFQWAHENLAFVNLACTSLPMRYYDFKESIATIMPAEQEDFHATDLRLIREAQAAGLIHTTVPPEVLSELFHGMLLTALDQYAAKPDHYTPEQMARFLWDFLAHGLGTRRAAESRAAE